jgi:hypothetical protein
VQTSLLKTREPPIIFPGDGHWPYDNTLTGPRLPTDPDITDLVKMGIQPYIAGMVRRGPHNAEWLLPLLTHLSPNTVRRLLIDPRNRGLHEPDRAAREQMVRQAAWLYEAECHDKTLDDLNGYFFVRDFGGKPRVCRWDDRGEFRHQSVADFKTAHGEKTISWTDPDGSEQREHLAKRWLRSLRTPRYDRVEFLPGQDAPPHVMNLWRGWPLPYYEVDNSPGEPIGCERFLEHVRHNICRDEEEVYFYLLGWMADAVQNVHRTSEVAVVMRGPQGSGKTLFAERLLEFFAPHTLVLAKPEQLTGNFNAHLLDKSMVFADEAFFAGHRQEANSLKTLITSGSIPIQPKGVDTFMAPKRFRLIISSNDEHVVRAEGDDRRFLVLDVNAGSHNQDRDYFGKIMEEWSGGGRVALFRWLRGAYWRKTLETGAWDVGLRPRTAELDRQKNESMSKADRAVHNMLLAGEVPCDFTHDAGRVFVATRLLAQAEKLNQKEETALGDKLRVLAGSGTISERRYLGVGSARRQHRGFWLPPLAECRRRWEAHLRRSVEWPADVPTWALEERPF